MNPVEFKDQNIVYKKPSNMSDEQCSSLYAKQHIIELAETKFNSIESVWELSDEDIKLIQQSKRIRLQVIASGMPPVNLMVEPVEEEVNYKEEDGPNVKHWKNSNTVTTTRLLEDKQILEVNYKNGKTNHYLNFPTILWNDLIKAHSIGQFINKNVKVQFESIIIK